MVTLYVANKNYSSWSLRPWVLMRELGIAFDEQVRPFTDGPALAFGDVSPSGRFPCLVDGDTVVWDSLSIAEYVAETHPQVWPADRQARAFARSAAAEMHSGFQHLRNICGMNVGIRVKLNEVTDGLKGDLARLEALWHDGFTRFGGPYLAGDAFTAALAVRLAEGCSLAEAGPFASAAAALTTTRLGAAVALPRRDEVLALLERVAGVGAPSESGRPKSMAKRGGTC